ncbi:hypothetical protein JVU11DRAFT_11933 [Chiua virens]|nr:hypothetical protein JVU11DRAFT_11933 [Chiua virens]
MFIKKVTVFHGAVKYVDEDLSVAPGNMDGAVKTYKLTALYDRYFEYAKILAAQHLIKEAVKYLKLTPEAYTGFALDFVMVHKWLLTLSGQTSQPHIVIPSNGATSKLVPRPPSVLAPVVLFQDGDQYAPSQPVYQSTHPVYPQHNTGIPYMPQHVKPPVGPPPIFLPVLSALPMCGQNKGWNDPPEANKVGHTAGLIGAPKCDPIVSPFPNIMHSPPTPSSPFSGHGPTFLPPQYPTSVQNLPPPPWVLPPVRSISTAAQPPVQPLPHAGGGHYAYVTLTGICSTQTITWAVRESYASSGTSMWPHTTAGTIWVCDAAAWHS